MAGVLRLRRLALFAEEAYLAGAAYDYGESAWDGHGCEESGAPRSLPEHDEWVRNCRVYFHRAVYRVLLAGPALCGWYLEPFAAGGDLKRLPLELPSNLQEFVSSAGKVHGLQEDDLVYIEQFPAFDQGASARLDESQDNLFGPLARFLVQSMKENIAPADLEWVQEEPCGGWDVDMSQFRDGSVQQGKLILREVMRMLTAFETLAKPLLNADGRYRHGRCGLESTLSAREILSDKKEARRQRRTNDALLVILGVFQLEQISLSEDAAPLVVPAIRSAEGLSRGSAQSEDIDISSLQEYLYCRSGRVNCQDGAATTPPRYKLFDYLLRRTFRVQFQQGYLWTPGKYQDFLEFLSNGTAFTNTHGTEDDNWTTSIVEDASSQPAYSFLPID
jgi:hypothetical protein